MKRLNDRARKPWMNGRWSAALIFVLFAGLGFMMPYASTSNICYAQNSGNNNNNNNNSSNNNNNSNGNSRDYTNFGYRSAVGGFAINAKQAFQAASKVELASYSDSLRSNLATVPAGLDQVSSVRKISLRRLGELLRTCAAEKKVVPESAQFLGGLTAIEHVIAVPEDKDIYLVGPAEGWTVDATGCVVGKESGKPILLLEDLLTVFRAWNTQAPELITCSIDPSREALQNFARMAKIVDPQQIILANRQAMGMMNVSFSGIPSQSRMACVLAAADYRMKRLSLGFDASPVRSLKSYTSMIRKSGSASYAPRFWMEPEYGTLQHDTQGLVWKVANTQVNTMTEREYFDQAGNRNVSTIKDVTAQRWAQMMTKCFKELAVSEPVFAEAKNCMDIALVVALVYFQNLPQKSGCSLDAFNGVAGVVTPGYPTPNQVDCDSLVKVVNRQGDYVAVTGGIVIDPWTVVRNKVAVNADLAKLQTPAVFEKDAWWSN
ncbi:MAG: DUF1598 domain-containing protein [Planctomycetia bacterium]|nr:DUF1598 domain-containing protein [Planctomycetia bacterium]